MPVTGVQTCALPIYRLAGLLVGGADDAVDVGAHEVEVERRVRRRQLLVGHGHERLLLDDFLPVLLDGHLRKADIVARDEREAGVRKILNFGHTIGHAVESLSGWSMPHGESVAIGMVVEARIAELSDTAEEGLSGIITQVLRDAGLPVTLPVEIMPDAVIAATRADKKARGGGVEYALPARLGVMAGAEQGYGIAVRDEIVREALFASR